MTTKPTVHVAPWFRELPDDALYKHPDGRPDEPQPVTLHLDRNAGEAWAEVVAEVGTARPRDETTVLGEIPSTTVTAAIRCLEEMTPALQANLDGTPEPNADSWSELAEATQAGEPWPRYADPAVVDGYFAEPYSDGVSADMTDAELQTLAAQMSEPLDEVSELISPRATLEYLTGIRDELRAEPTS